MPASRTTSRSTATTRCPRPCSRATQFPGIADRGVSDPGARCGDVLLPLRRPPDDERHGGGRSPRGRLGSAAANRRRTPTGALRPVRLSRSSAPLLAWSAWAADASSSPPQCARAVRRRMHGRRLATTGRRTSSGRRRWTSPLPRWPATRRRAGRSRSPTSAGNVVVVNFWATWCGPCRDEQPELVRSGGRLPGRGVEFLGVNERDDTAKARAWIEEFDVPYPSIVDDRRLGRRLRVLRAAGHVRGRRRGHDPLGRLRRRPTRRS